MIKANATLVKIFHDAMREERSMQGPGMQDGPDPNLVGLRAVFASDEFHRQLREEMNEIRKLEKAIE